MSITTTPNASVVAPAAPADTGAPGRSRAAVTAGAGLLAMAAVAIPANAVLQPLTGAADPDQLAARLADSGAAARFAVLGFTVVVVLDLLVAWGLARFLHRDTPSLGALAGWLRVGYAGMLGAAVISLGEGVRAGTGTDATDTVVSWAGVQGFAEGWRLALLVFGVHLFVVGAALLRTRGVPRWLAVAVVVAGLAYAVDTVVRTLLVDPSSAGPVLTVVVAVLATVGELGFAVWLLVRGRRS
jgi:hypothetical protein